MVLIRCNECGWIGEDKDLEFKHDLEYCPKCKKNGSLMDLDTGCNFTENEIEILWNMLEKILSLDGKIKESFLGFPQGTQKEKVWCWFDETYPTGVQQLFMKSAESQMKDYD